MKHVELQILSISIFDLNDGWDKFRKLFVSKRDSRHWSRENRIE